MSDVSRMDLPGLNYLAPLKADDFEFGENITATEILQRFQAVFGANFASLNQFGVVSDVNPQTSSSLIMSIGPASASDPFTYLVQPGIAVTPKGQLIIITSAQQVTIPQVNGQAYVVIAKYVLDDELALRYTQFGTPVYAHRDVDTSSQLEVMLVSDFLLLSSASVSSRVPLGVVTVSTNPNTLALLTTLDMTTGTYSWNRPWFSPVDYYHRNQKGNVHEATLEELDQGAVPLMQKFMYDGFIIAQDVQYPFFPGHLCVQEIKRSSFPSSPPYTTPLIRFPVRLGRLYLKSDSTKEFPYYYDPSTNTITLQCTPPTPSGEETMDMRLDALVVDSFEPTLLSTTARFSNVSSKGESAISQGVPIRSMSSTDVPLNNFGPGATQRARVYISGDGTLLRSPTTLLCQARLNIDIFPGEDVTISASSPLPGVLRLIVRDTVNVSGQVVVTGVDVSGAALEEVITFSYNSTYPNGYLPSPSIELDDDVSQFGKLTSGDTGVTLVPEMRRATRLITGASCPCRYSANVFSSVSSIRLENLVGGSSAGTLTLQTLLDTRGLLQLAEIVENDGIVQNLVDNRRILTGLSMVNRGVHAAITYADAELGDRVTLMKYLENFTEPQFGDFRLTNLEDPLNSMETSSPASRRGDSIFYSSRFLPLHNFGSSSYAYVTVNLSLLSELYRSSSSHGRSLGSVVDVHLYFYSMALGLPVQVYDVDLDGRRMISNTYTISPVFADAIQVKIRGYGIDGFALSAEYAIPG